MPALKFRQQIIPAGGLVSNNNFLFGKVVVNCPSAVGYTVVTASTAITGIADGDVLLAQVATGAPSGMVLKSACAVAGGISASWANSASTNQAASGNASLFYLAFS